MKLIFITLAITVVVMVLGILTGCSGTPVVEVTETIDVADSPQISPAVLVRVEENIGVADSPQMPTSPEIRDFETIGVTDLLNVQAALMINVTETIGVTDTPTILLPIDIRIVETIGVTDTPTVKTSQQQSLPTINFFIADPDHINRGGSSTLAWNVTGATTITIDHNIGNVSSIGTIVVKPGLTTTYNMKATNSAGSVKAAVTVTVTIKLF